MIRAGIATRVAAKAAIAVLGCLLWAGVARGAPDPAEIRVMSFNIRYGTAQDGENAWDLRREALRTSIRDFAPDLLGTQECLKEQAEWLIERMPEYGFVGVGREDGRQGGEMCAIFFRADRFRPEASGHFWLSESPDSAGSRSWDSALPRMVSWVRLRPQIDTLRTIVFFNTHFDHVGVEARRRSAELLRKRASEIAAGSPIIVAGDFNAPADSLAAGPYRVLTADETLVDSYRALHAASSGEGTYHAFKGSTGGPRIDWILVSPELHILDSAILQARVDDRWTSDHFPVTAVLRILD